jgi:hypothetical protein
VICNRGLASTNPGYAQLYYTFLYYNVLKTCDMSRVLLVGTNDSHKNQKIRHEIHNLVDKAYYVDPIKMDKAMAYLDNFVTE